MLRRILCLLLTALLLLAAAAPALAEYKIYLTDEAREEMEKYSTLKYGSSGRAVLRLQERLVELGYLCGTPHGEYDRVTEDAVFYFQITNNLTGSDGVAYPYTQYKLFDEFAIPCGGETYCTVWPGDVGWEVERLQKRLIDLGYLEDGQADGVYGRRTEQAVYNFRVKNDLYPYITVAEDWVLDALFSSMIESN